MKSKVYFTLFVVSFVIMGLEMTATRLIAPSFGNTVYTWGIIISIFLIGSSVGYIVGGYLADKANIREIMLFIYLIGILSIAIIPLIKTTLFPLLESLSSTPGTMLGVLLLYLIPNFLLSVIGTVLMKDGIGELASGKVIGSLHSASAIGSVLGTLVTTFWLIPWTNINSIIGILAGLVYLTSIFYCDTKTKMQGFLLIIPALFVALPFVSVGDNSQDVLFKKTSLYHDILVLEKDFYQGKEGRFRSLTFGNKTTIQGMMDMNKPDKLLLDYSKSVWEISKTLAPESKEVYMIGHGIGALTRKFEDTNKNILVAEIDEEVVDVSRQYFQYTGNSVKIGDGRKILKEQKSRFDLIFLDAYNNTTQIPFHLITKEFFELTSEKLNSNGILVINAIGEQKGDLLIESMSSTLKSVYPYVYIYGKDDGKGIQNITIVGGKYPIEDNKINGHNLIKVGKGKVILDSDTKLTNLN
ncbi:fused MFS/spermidine synthase (plasmid) [Cytobacillus firmus]|uniref:fused MFS/spermidine synthase n=1 Tax=Cytobacillus firmus TaxID=1399 RepID=UPI002079DD58|nr:fused MFS/spermidine synthase [Cytobacillus firmus]USK41758.1 fused MFS/spermidine synthase [Cytobacillus firmus]